MRRVLANWKYLVFYLLGGQIMAVHVSHCLMPARHALVPVQMNDGWITTPSSSKRGYFRHTLQLPMEPKHAWVSIAAEDYQLFVNGNRVAENRYVVNGGHPFQSRLADRSQRLHAQSRLGSAAAPALQHRANEEWRMVHFYDIGRYLHAGRNTVAVYAQSATVNHLAVEGAASADSQVVEIPGRASAWRAASESTARGVTRWYDPDFEDVDWGTARPYPAPAKPMFAVIDPDVWRKPFTAQAITAPVSATEVVFRTTCPADLRPRSGWLRVRSSRRYEIFIGEDWVGRGEGDDRLLAFDISKYLRCTPVQIAIRTWDPGGSEVDAEVPWLAVDGLIGSVRISSGPGWTWLSSFHPDWIHGAGRWDPVVSHAAPEKPAGIRLQMANAAGVTRLSRMAVMGVLIAAALAAVAWGLSRGFRRGVSAGGGRGLKFSTWLLTPTVFGILVVELLRFRFQDTDTTLFFLAPSHAWWPLLTGPLLLLATILLVAGPAGPLPRLVSGLTRAATRVHPLIWLALILIVGLSLRAYHMGFQDLEADEPVSWDAARGILRTGTPQVVSGVYYTRSPLYHYGLAAWLFLVGDSIVGARSFSLIPGMGVLVALYLLVRAVTGRRLLGLVAALIMAVHPWAIEYSYRIRFYQQMQFLAVVSMLLFLKAFVWKEGRRYQVLFFVCATAAVLSHEVFIACFPALAVAFVVFYRPFRWKADYPICICFAAMMLLALLDVGIFSTVCMTPHVNIAITSGPIMKLNFLDVTGFPTMFFAGITGTNFIYSLACCAGALFWIARPNRIALVLFGIVVGTVATLTVLVLQVANRYYFCVLPLFIAVAVISIDALIRHAAEGLSPSVGTASARAKRLWIGLMGAIALAAALVNAEPARILDSYGRKRFAERESAVAYILEHRQQGDKIMSAHPQPAAIYLGGIDYYLVEQVWFDQVYMQKDGIVGRWAGGKLISKLDQCRRVFQEHDRVWVWYDEKKLHQLAPEFRDFLFTLCEVKREFFGGKVLLWDKTAGRFGTFRDDGGASDTY